MPTFGWDQQIVGVRDNGTEHGIVSTEIKRGNLVAVPFRFDLVTQVLNGSTASMSGGFSANGDGTHSGFLVTVPASATFANYAVLRFWIEGNVFGLRFDRTRTGNPPCSVMIDSVAYPVNTNTFLDPLTQVASSTTDAMCGQVLATDLGDGPHFVEVLYPCAASGSNRVSSPLGIIVDAAAGYVPVPRGVQVAGTVYSVPNSFNWPSSANVPTGYGIRKLIFANTTAAPVQVSLRWQSGTTFWSRPVPANDTIEFDPGAVIYDRTQMQVQAGSSSAITMLIVEAC